ncbi:DUF2793 domain-containing protein [Roseovarius atlanticus]|uniref:DUF2793 domain-containing protein n=1 Tax=Roseovarius atlanticus TaxID=1641875 RepID=UPI00070A2391|nr:DUF2793 domain-containing protein [Roseovarius atlanticus]
MSDTSPTLGLPLIQPSQAQKHVTHNEALRVLDAVTQLSVASADLATPPSNPDDGVRYIVAPTGQSAWAGQDNAIALFTDGVWEFFAPRTGWRADVTSTGATLRFDGTAWQDIALPETLPQLGLNASADTTNRLAVAADATLLTHDSAGHQLKINKNSASDTASLLFQTGFSGRTEMGTTGSDDFAVKVSNDGTTFRSALIASADNGALQVPSGQLFFRDVFVMDDTTYSFDIPFSSPARILMWLGMNLQGYYFLFSITGSLNGAGNFGEMFSNPAGKITFHSGPLTGTTGPDGSINLAIDTTGATPRMHLENRFGSNRLFTMATLGR